MRYLLTIIGIHTGLAGCLLPAAEPRKFASHPPLRTVPAPSQRPFAAGPARYVDPSRGDDGNDGAEKSPWRTVRHAVTRLQAGDTLYLRDGIYHENVYLARAGRPDAPITIRSAPGEQATIDGSFPEFHEKPAEAWEPFAQGGPGEYRSKRSYPNLRTVVGSFGDSMIGLQTYYHAKDLRSTNELVDWEDWSRIDRTDIKPLYCGPGLWYDPATGHIHVRLAHTHLPEPIANYRGETDPRRLSLIIAPFHATPLHLDGAQHIRLQDLVIRGAGYAAVVLDHAVDVEFDNVTVWCGAYGIRAGRTGPLRFHRSALYGSIAPWTFRSDGSKRDYPGRPHRNISRLNTHALLEIESGLESSVYATPQNDQWEFSYSDFTDAHDALYLGAINVRFHHNLIDNLQDDGLYLSPMYHRHRLDKKDPQIHIYQNLFRGMLTALAFGGSEAVTRDQIFIYRNVFDLRYPLNAGRPTTRAPAPVFSRGKVIGDHGSPPWPAMTIYHNTFVMADASRDAAMATFGGSTKERPRRVFNNLFFHLSKLPGFAGPDPTTHAIEDGNLYSAPQPEEATNAAFFNRFRMSPMYARSKMIYQAGSTTNSQVGRSSFVRAVADPSHENDYRLQEKSAAVNAGIDLPMELPDPVRERDQGKPDIGALPLGSEPLVAGRSAAPK